MDVKKKNMHTTMLPLVTSVRYHNNDDIILAIATDLLF